MNRSIYSLKIHKFRRARRSLAERTLSVTARRRRNTDFDQAPTSPTLESTITPLAEVGACLPDIRTRPRSKPCISPIKRTGENQAFSPWPGHPSFFHVGPIRAGSPCHRFHGLDSGQLLTVSNPSPVRPCTLFSQFRSRIPRAHCTCSAHPCRPRSDGSGSPNISRWASTRS